MGRVAERTAVVALRAYHALDVEWVTAKPLPSEVVAQVIRAYGELEIQVNDLIPFSRLREAARHTIKRHGTGCYTRVCPYARALMRDFAVVAVRPAVPVDAEIA